jgi:methionyl-tRNA synthetase
MVPAGDDLLGAFNSEGIKRSALGNPYVVGALKDLSISRTTFDWGIKVPGNEKHVVYVWLDALANYMTAVGYGSDAPADIVNFEKYWPADLHLVGKEITRFHCVYWPAFLMAAGLPLPKSVVANGWLLFEESKMSKSRGNVVRTETILDAFGPLCPPVPRPAADPSTRAVILIGARSAESKDPETASPGDTARNVPPANSATLAAPTKAQQDLFAADVIRYFLLREIPFGQDGSFSFDALITRYNADLANGYGNLVSRTLSMIEKYFDGLTPERSDGMTDSGIETVMFGTFGIVGRSITDLDFNGYLKALWSFLGWADGYLTNNAPWKARKEMSQLEMAALRADTLYTAAECIRVLTAYLYPVMPYATASVWAQLGLGDIEEAARNGELKNLQWGGLKPGTKLGPLAPIFPRADKGLAQIMTDMENPSVPAATVPPAAAPATTDPAAAPCTSTLPTSPESTKTEPAASGTSNLELGTSTTISIDDFVKIDLRVAQIVVAERIPKADKLLRLEVDLGYERRQILSGIAEFYTPEELIGKRIAIIANLAPRKMRGLESHGMLLAASGEDHSSKPILATFSDEIALGSRIR